MKLMRRSTEKPSKRHEVAVPASQSEGKRTVREAHDPTGGLVTGAYRGEAESARRLPADGTPGGAKRVMKCFPVIDAWQAKVSFAVIDEIITRDILQEFLEVAGSYIGIGSFRPENRGIWVTGARTTSWISLSGYLARWRDILAGS